MSDLEFLLQIIPRDFDVELIEESNTGGIFAGRRTDVLHFVRASNHENENGFYQTNISQSHIPRFLIAEAIAGQEEFNRHTRKESTDGIPMATGECSEIGLFSRGTGVYDFEDFITQSGMPKELWEGDQAPYREAVAKVKDVDGLYILPRAKSFSGNPVTSSSRRLIEAIAFERLVCKKLNARRFGIYSAFCTWKDFCEEVIKPRSFFEELVDDQFIYDAEEDIYGSFMDLAILVQDELLSKRIWGKSIKVDRDEAVSIIQDGFSRLSDIQLAQFTLMNGMHSAGLFLPLAQVLGLNSWDTYIKWKTQPYKPDSEEEQSIRTETAIIKMLGELSD